MKFPSVPDIMEIFSTFCWICALLYANALVVAKELHPDSELSMQEVITKYGYPVEDHYIVTKDNYILNMQRIPYGKVPFNGVRKPLLLMHGLMGSAENFILTGPEKAFAYKFADDGYDVWLGNARGSMHSRNHTKLNPDKDKAYWQFSFHQIGAIDIPAKIDYILEKTQQNKLFYIGHSQGTTVLLIALAENPEYNSKVELATLMAPSAFNADMRHPFLYPLCPFHYFFNDLAEMLNINELIPNVRMLQYVGKNMCEQNSGSLELCANILFLIGGYNSAQLNRTEIPFYMSKIPAGCSTKQPLHFAQGIASGKFRQYDFGQEKNMKIYKSATPPDYNLDNIVAPVALLRGKNDWLIPEKGVKKLAKKLPNLAMNHVVEDKMFTHLDFIIGMNMVEVVYKPVKALMDSYAYNNNTI